MRFRVGLLDFAEGDVLAFAPLAERMGISRIWLAEHQDPTAAYADSLMMSMAIAAVTRRLRVGPGGVLLRFRSTLSVANSARLLDSMFPGRIDLGLAGGTVQEPELSAFLDGRADYASREDHIQKIVRTISHLRNTSVERAIPHSDAAPITWILDSRGELAEVAGSNGAAYALSVFHSRARPDPVAVAKYRNAFVPSAELPQPAVIVAAAVEITLESQMYPRSRAGIYNPICGTPEECHQALAKLVEDYDVDEVVMLDLSVDSNGDESGLARLAKLCGLTTPEAFGIGPTDEYVPCDGDMVWRTEHEALEHLLSATPEGGELSLRVYGLFLPNGWRADVTAPDAQGGQRLVSKARVATI